MSALRDELALSEKKNVDRLSGIGPTRRKVYRLSDERLRKQVLLFNSNTNYLDFLRQISLNIV